MGVLFFNEMDILVKIFDFLISQDMLAKPLFASFVQDFNNIWGFQLLVKMCVTPSAREYAFG
jgi:hypothetical protein